MPVGLARLHVQQDRLHAVGQHRLGQAPKGLEGRHQAAQQRRRIGALDEGHEAHPRIAEHRGKPKQLAGLSPLLVEELAPVKLQLFAGLGLVADHRPTSRRRRRTQGTHEIFEDRDAPGVALCLQPGEHGLTVQQMILAHPAPDLLFIDFQLRCPPQARPCLRDPTDIPPDGIARHA